MIPHEAVLEKRTSVFHKGVTQGRKSSTRADARARQSEACGAQVLDSRPSGSSTKLRGRRGIGFVTSAAFSPDAKPAIGMGTCGEHFASGSVVEFDGGTAEVSDS